MMVKQFLCVFVPGAMVAAWSAQNRGGTSLVQGDKHDEKDTAEKEESGLVYIYY